MILVKPAIKRNVSRSARQGALQVSLPWVLAVGTKSARLKNSVIADLAMVALTGR